jgi:hypothetical protein
MRARERWEAHDGTLASFAWPGGYPIIYIADDGGVFCPDCANGKNGSDASFDAEPGSGWRIEAGDIFYEGAPITCDHCATTIESAYGDPETEGASS